ncbi:FAD-dependent thymidylate synthase [Candidatus Uhrbacteria bacterium]|nr:FAD-dependent thymidylate synthase [Candidatus Uhrbacteria bacterium]
MSIESLSHVTRKLPNGGTVLVLNTGAVITPEAEAMLQALHSRSVGGVTEHLKKLQEKGSDRFMSSFYVGYGHKSIGDCGSITVFIEGVSMLAAKAIQDWPLYSGQESSTRYIDFSTQPFIDPVRSVRSTAILEAWRRFYCKGLPPTRARLQRLHPRSADEQEAMYDKAIDARAFDIMRGFLPAGASTNLAWHSNLRQMADKLALLRHHPLGEIRDIATALESALLEAHPSSFGHKRHEATEQYHATWMTQENYFSHTPYSSVELLRNDVDRLQLAAHRDLLARRPQKTELPKFLGECGTLQFGFLLDFGSFRDLQRHRAIHQRMPLVTTKHGFHPWYFQELPEELLPEARTLLADQEQAIAALDLAPEVAQYYTAMGYRLPNRITGTLPALVYLVELRATRFVHPTLAAIAGAMANILASTFANEGLVLHLDQEPGRFDVRRGAHDIRETAASDARAR